MDVKTVFLYSKIDIKVYVKLPPNLRSKHLSIVYKLNKALYSLKQTLKI